ncbi:MAG: SO_0444 family Cu/Zn efflux transporter [Pirellulales bacterium]|nr:SO_0444 family Cu/Zn efflux transporter [Pirellulales bacterium]
MNTVVGIALQSWLVLGQMAPYLLFGFLMAGLLSVCISPQWVERHLGSEGAGPVLKAALFGVPLPLCSCSVIPVSASMYRHGASRAATSAFLLSTPQTGADSIAITYALLGPVFAVFRPVVALLTGLLGGYVVQLFDTPGGGNGSDGPRTPACTEACCQGNGSGNPLTRILRYGLITLPRDIGVALLIGVLIAGTIAVLVPQGRLEAYVGVGIGSILLMMAAGVPVYVCASASVPIAAGFIHLGVSPGAALAFLVAGPATNAATCTTIWRLLGRRTAVLYLLSVAVSAIAGGMLLNWLIPTMRAPIPELGSHVHETHGIGWLAHAGAITLLGVMGFSYLVTAWDRKSRTENGDQPEGTGTLLGRERLEMSVRGMSCSHCADAVRHALAECAGVSSAEVDAAGGRAVVTGEYLNREQLVAAVAQLGYTAGFSEKGD